MLYEESGKDNIPFDFFKEVYILTFLSLVDCSSNLHKVNIYIYTLMGMINLSTLWTKDTLSVNILNGQFGTFIRNDKVQLLISKLMFAFSYDIC